MTAAEQQMQLYHLLVENSLGLMCVHTLDGVLLTINPAAAASLGYAIEELVGQNIRKFLAPAVRPFFDDYLERIRSNPSDSGVMRLQARDGAARLWFYRNVRYVRPDSQTWVLGHAIDITERMAAERALRQSQSELAAARDELEQRVAERTAELRHANERLQAEMEERRQVEEELYRARKLEALGGLAGGIAHDFNNLMTIIGGYCSLLQASLADDLPLREQVNEIRKAAEQANSLTRQLLAFSRRQTIQPALLNLNEVATEMTRMLQRLLRDDIELSILTESGLGLIRCDRGQLEQVIMNLAINAADAMPQGGRLVLAASNVNLDENYTRRHLGVRPGDYVRLTVTDTGEGMNEETRARIFDPFFTTKEPGKGTGLGLATVYGVVKQANAHIVVESEPAKGTTFHIYFPRVAETAAREPLNEPQFHPAPRGSETVLIVDDQEGLRTLLTEVLRKNGYNVLAARNGREALRIAGEHNGDIGLVVTDIVMPRMGGSELAAMLARSRPGTRILCMSGYADRSSDIGALLSAGHAFIEKPFTTEAFLTKVREILDTPASARREQRIPRAG